MTSTKDTCVTAADLALTLKQAAARLPASDSRQAARWHLLYHSSTIEERVEIIGLLKNLNDKLGVLVKLFSNDAPQRSSKTDSLTSLFYTGPTE